MPQILWSIGLRSGLFGGHKNLEVYRGDQISEIVALSEWRPRMMHKLCEYKHNMRKRSEPGNLSKPILWYRNVYNQIASDISEIDNPVHKFTTDKPRMVLINVLIRAIFKH